MRHLRAAAIFIAFLIFLALGSDAAADERSPLGDPAPDTLVASDAPADTAVVTEPLLGSTETVSELTDSQVESPLLPSETSAPVIEDVESVAEAADVVVDASDVAAAATETIAPLTEPVEPVGDAVTEVVEPLVETTESPLSAVTQTTELALESVEPVADAALTTTGEVIDSTLDTTVSLTDPVQPIVDLGVETPVIDIPADSLSVDIPVVAEPVTSLVDAPVVDAVVPVSPAIDVPVVDLPVIEAPVETSPIPAAPVIAVPVTDIPAMNPTVPDLMPALETETRDIVGELMPESFVTPWVETDVVVNPEPEAAAVAPAPLPSANGMGVAPIDPVLPSPQLLAKKTSELSVVAPELPKTSGTAGVSGSTGGRTLAGEQFPGSSAIAAALAALVLVFWRERLRLALQFPSPIYLKIPHPPG